MKRIILFLLTYSIHLTALEQAEFKNNLELDQDEQSLHDQKINELEEQLKILKARRTSPKPQLQERFSSHLTLKPERTNSNRLNFAEYNREDTLTEQTRTTEDKFLKDNWAREDKAAEEIRNQEGFWVRLTKKTTADGATDSEKEQTRNKRILEINRERIFKDFEIKAKRFQDFKDTYPDFSKKEPWNSLLELGDMNKFMKMSHASREILIQQIESQTKSILEDNFSIDSNDVSALQDIMQLTNSNKLPENLQQSYSQTLTAEFSEKTPEEKQKIIDNLKIILKESLQESLAQLKHFNDAMELIKHDINSLDHARTLKNAGNAAFWILGTAAGICMLGHGALVVEGVQITMEKFAIGAKIGLAAGHVGAHSEAEIAKHIQTQFKKIIEPLLPKTTKLLETITYKNRAKGLGERLREKISKITDFAKSKFSEETRNNIHNNLQKLKSSAANLAKSISESSFGKQVNHGKETVGKHLSSGLKTAKEALSNTHQKVTNSDPYKKLSSALSNLKNKFHKNSDNDDALNSEDAAKRYQEFNPTLGYNTSEQN